MIRIYPRKGEFSKTSPPHCKKCGRMTFQGVCPSCRRKPADFKPTPPVNPNSPESTEKPIDNPADPW